MHTTIALQPSTRDRLMALKRAQRLPTMDAVVLTLLDPAPLGARDLFALHEKAVQEVCQQFGVTRLVAHGSRVRGDARPDSDLDLVASLPPNKSLFDLARLGEALTQAFGVRVDLATDGPHLGALRDILRKDGQVLLG